MEKPLKVLLLVHTFTIIGGYENLVRDLSNYLSEKIEVHIVCYNLGNINNIKISKNLKIHQFTHILNTKFISIPLNALINNIKLLYIIRKEKISIINVHPVFPAGLDVILAKLFGAHLVCTSHGSDIQINNVLNYGVRRNFFANFMIRCILKISDYHTVVSNSMISDAINAGSYPSKIRVINNGIDLQCLPNSKDFLDSKYSFDKENFLILYLGRLHVKKCPDDLIKAMQIVSSEVRSAKLIIAGKGEEESNLKQLVKKLKLSDRVLFTGFVSDKEKWQLMMNCDVFVLPSEIEAFGISLIEAMACKKPVVVTNIGAFTEIVKHKETGIIIPLHSPQDIAEAIIELFKNPDLRYKIGLFARKEIENRFDIAKISEDYLNLYIKCLLT